VLDLLVTLAAGKRPSPEEVATLHELPGVMQDAQRKANRLERQVVDIAEAWTLRDCVGKAYEAVMVGRRGDSIEVQIEEPPVHATIRGAGVRAQLGDAVRLELTGVDVARGEVHFRQANDQGRSS
jgi:exoribonuclease R